MPMGSRAANATVTNICQIPLTSAAVCSNSWCLPSKNFECWKNNLRNPNLKADIKYTTFSQLATPFRDSSDQSMQSYLFLTEIFPYFKALLRNNSHTIWFTHLKHTTQWFLVFSQNCATAKWILEHFHHPKRNPVPNSSLFLFLFPSSPGNHYLLSVSIDFLFWIFHINTIMEYVVFYDWLLSLCMMPSRFIYTVACIGT